VRVDQLCAAYHLQARYVHFPLHPDTPDEGLTLEQLFAGRDVDLAAMRERMAGLMREAGLEYGDRPRTYNSRLAQELACWAVHQKDDTQKAGEAIHLALFRAYFVDDVNLAVVDHLVEIAAGVGLDGAAARRALETRQYRSAVDADWERSRQLGVTGVPTYVAGGRGAVGAQPYKVLERLALEAGAVRR